MSETVKQQPIQVNGKRSCMVKFNFKQQLARIQMLKSETSITPSNKQLQSSDLMPINYYEERISVMNQIKQQRFSKPTPDTGVQCSLKEVGSAVELDEPTIAIPSYDQEELNYRTEVYSEVDGILEASVGDTVGRVQFLGILKSFHHMYQSVGKAKEKIK